MTDLMDSPLLAPLADLLTPDKVETLQEMARVFYSNRSDISSVARHFMMIPSAQLNFWQNQTKHLITFFVEYSGKQQKYFTERTH